MISTLIEDAVVVADVGGIIDEDSNSVNSQRSKWKSIIKQHIFYPYYSLSGTTRCSKKLRPTISIADVAQYKFYKKNPETFNFRFLLHIKLLWASLYNFFN